MVVRKRWKLTRRRWGRQRLYDVLGRMMACCLYPKVNAADRRKADSCMLQTCGGHVGIIHLRRCVAWSQVELSVMRYVVVSGDNKKVRRAEGRRRLRLLGRRQARDLNSDKRSNHLLVSVSGGLASPTDYRRICVCRRISMSRGGVWAR